MLNRKTVDNLIEILKKDLKRTKRMQTPGFPKVYYSSYLLRDERSFNILGSGGSLVHSNSEFSRHVYCDIRVGNYRYDQVMDGGLKDNEDELESSNYATVPLDDTCYDGLRLSLWRLSDAKYREALNDWNQKRSRRISNIDVNRSYDSFSRSKRVKYFQKDKLEKIDQKYWNSFCKRASQWMVRLPRISTASVELEALQTTKVFVNSEGSVIVQYEKIYSLIATLSLLTLEGLHLDQDLVINTVNLTELPDLKALKRLMSDKYQKLIENAGARKIHSFSGPVLLHPHPAGVLFHEAIGHRLEGNRLLSSFEGQTFKGQKGKRVLNLPLIIRDDPTYRRHDGQACVGSYDYDDEGVEAQNTLLMDDGVLKDYLSSRAPFRKGGFKSNGHGRNRRSQRPISRMGVTIIESKTSLSIDDLKQMLISEIIRQRKPFGLIVYDVSGGETDTTSYDFQAFSGEISYATLIYPDGSEEPVRGVNFVGTPLQALHNIIALGGEPQLNNSFCGAESGFIPVSTICPAMLLRSLELQSKEEQLVTRFILPRPRI